MTEPKKLCDCEVMSKIKKLMEQLDPNDYNIVVYWFSDKYPLASNE